MFKAKKSEENQIPLMESNTKLQEDNYLKNNYFSRTVEENDTLKKDVHFCLLMKPINKRYIFFKLIKLRKQELAFKKIIIEMEGKLDFYIKNSPVQPDFDNSSQKKEILGLLENFNDFADKVNLKVLYF